MEEDKLLSPKQSVEAMANARYWAERITKKKHRPIGIPLPPRPIANMAKLLANAKLYRNQNGEEPVNAGQELKSLLTGLFFSASWCAPCHQFTPQLRQFYERVNARSEKGFEVVFLSQDKTEAEMREYLEKHGDWLFLAHGDPLAKELKLKYGVQGIPALVLIREDGKIVSLDGAEEMQNCFCILDERKADSLVLNWQAQFGGNSQNKF